MQTTTKKANSHPARRRSWADHADDIVDELLQLAEDDHIDRSELEGTRAARGVDLLASDRIAEALGDADPASPEDVALAVVAMVEHASVYAPSRAAMQRANSLAGMVRTSVQCEGGWGDVEAETDRVHEHGEPFDAIALYALDVKCAMQRDGAEQALALRRAAATVLRALARALPRVSWGQEREHPRVMRDVFDVLCTRLDEAQRAS